MAKDHITARVPVSLKARVTAYSKSKGLPMSSIIASAIDDYLFCRDAEKKLIEEKEVPKPVEESEYVTVITYDTGKPVSQQVKRSAL
jgi:hypothetical protein